MSESEKESTLDESRVEQEEVETVGKEEREFFFGWWKKSSIKIVRVYFLVLCRIYFRNHTDEGQAKHNVAKSRRQ